MRNLSLISAVLVIIAVPVVMAVPVLAQKAAESQKSYAAEVTASRLHLRSGPSGAYQSVVLAAQGDKLVVRQSIAGGWAVVEVPGGFDAWVSARFVRLAAGKKSGEVTGQDLHIRPRPSTDYHHLAAKLRKGEKLKVIAEKTVGEDTWLKVRVPQRVPLYCAARYLTKIGPVSLAIPKAKSSTPAVGPAGAKTKQANGDARFIVIEKKALASLRGARTLHDLRPIQRTVGSVNEATLSLENRKRHLALERKLLDRERELVVAGVSEHEKELLVELEKKIKAIEAKYAQRLQQIEDERAAKARAKNRFTAVGIIEHKPDVFGRTPAFRIAKGGKLRYYVIAPAFNLYKFAGKRVGVIGMLDRESGTGYFTIMVKRIEIIGDK